MSKESGSSSNSTNELSLQKFSSMQISPLDDEGIIYDDDDDDDEEDEEEEEVLVTLGFVENPKKQWSLLPHLFPSKAGGTPAWLDPINLPSGSSCFCDFCAEPLQFLLQVYAPLSDKESTFHRTLFVFICPSMSCLLRDQHEQWKHLPDKPSRSIKVFRCQLPRCNQFYSSKPPRYDGSDKPLVTGALLCSWCGTWKGGKVCGNCRKARYCSEKHQVNHWRSGHKTQCRALEITLPTADSNSSDSSVEIQKAACKILWPEFEIIQEDESEFSIEISTSDIYGKALPDSFEDDGDKKSWATFYKRIARAQDQVLRYSSDIASKPLWPMLSGQPSNANVPKCSSCGSSRNFEFQILPQLLYYFEEKNDESSLDWATIVVYTCEASCDSTMAYKEEFAWVQLESQSAKTFR